MWLGLILVVLPALAWAEPLPVTYDVLRLRSGLVIPYPLDKVFRGFARCKRGRHTHRALDIGGVGPDWGVGTPVRAIARSRVTHIGTPEADPKRYGVRDMAEGRVRRRRSSLPRSKVVPGYGKVWFFTKDYGRLRTGVLLVTRVLEGRLGGYEISYMHLGAVHPSLHPGSILEAGQELGVLGGTAVMEDPPHVHVAIKNRQGRKVDLGPLFGIGSTRAPCRAGRQGQARVRRRYSRVAHELMRKMRRQRRKTPIVLRLRPGQDRARFEGRFELRKVKAHRFWVAPGPGVVSVSVEATSTDKKGRRWRPRLVTLTEGGALLHDGRKAKRRARKMRFRAEGTGRRGGAIGLQFRNRARPVVLHLKSWRGRPPRGATYRIVIRREEAPRDAP